MTKPETSPPTICIQYKGAVFNRGDVVFVFTSNGKFIFLNWKDLKHVLMLTTNTTITTEIGTCQRGTANESGKHIRITMPRPMIVEDYSKKMYYVDRGYINTPRNKYRPHNQFNISICTFRDQILDTLNRYTKRKAWPKKVQEHILGMAFVNSLAIVNFLLKKEDKKQMRTLQFKMDIMQTLFTIANRNKAKNCITILHMHHILQ